MWTGVGRRFMNPPRGVDTVSPQSRPPSQGLHPFMSRGRLRNILLACSRLFVLYPVVCVEQWLADRADAAAKANAKHVPIGSTGCTAGE